MEHMGWLLLKPSEAFTETDVENISASDFGFWVQIYFMSLLSNENLAVSMLRDLENRKKFSMIQKT